MTAKNKLFTRGVPVQQYRQHCSNQTSFTCQRGLADYYTIPLSFVNDNYCDCPFDGRDEPGTSACMNGNFFCEIGNTTIPTTMVDDGICDCCDGSDEVFCNMQ